MDPEKKGIPNLIKALITHQRKMIIQFKPEMHRQLLANRTEAHNQLKALPACFKTDNEKNDIFIKMLTDFSQMMRDSVQNCRQMQSIAGAELQNNQRFELRSNLRGIFEKHSD